jgi:hypothetical protein
MPRKPKNVGFQNCQYIVTRFVREGTIPWAREIKIAKQLLASYPEIGFWENLFLTFPLNSLAWFLGDGADFLSAEYRRVSSVEVPKPPVFQLEGESLYKAPTEETIPRTLSEFLK